MLSKLLALLLVTLPIQTPAPATAPASAESLIPANALAVIRIRSIDAVEHAAQAIVPGSKVGDEMLGALPMVAQAQVVTEQIDRGSPIILAAVPSQVHPPVEMMIILTCKDPAAFTAPLEKMGWTCTTAGKIVACSPSKPGPSLAADAPMRMGLDRNDIVLRIAMEQTMSQFGELLKAGLDQEAQQVESQIPDENAGAQVSSMLTSLSESLDEMETLEINVSQRGDQTRLGFEMTALDGSDLAKVAKVDVSGLPAAARVVEEGGAMSMLVAMDVSKWVGFLQNIFDAASKSMPEESRATFAALMNMSKELASLQGPIMAGNFDFTADGMRGGWFMQPKDPALFMSKMMQIFSADIPWMKLTKTDHSQVDGIDVSTFHFTMAPEGFPTAGASKAIKTPEAQAALDKELEAMFGPGGPQYSMAIVNGALISAMGDAGQLKLAMARVASKTSSPLGTELLKEMGGMNPGFVYRIDFGRLMGMMGSIAARMEAAGAPNVTSDMEMMRAMPPLSVSGGVEGRVWKLGISTDVAKFAAAAMMMKSAIEKPIATKVVMGGPRARAKADMRAIFEALVAYAMDNAGKFPDHLEALVTPDKDGKRYLAMQKLPVDPWGHAYIYTAPSPGHPDPRIISLGADGRVGGTGDNADIDNLSEDRDDR